MLCSWESFVTAGDIVVVAIAVADSIFDFPKLDRKILGYSFFEMRSNISGLLLLNKYISDQRPNPPHWKCPFTWQFGSKSDNRRNGGMPSVDPLKIITITVDGTFCSSILRHPRTLWYKSQTFNCPTFPRRKRYFNSSSPRFRAMKFIGAIDQV